MFPAMIPTSEARSFSRGDLSDWGASLVKLLEAASKEVDSNHETAKALIAEASSLLQIQIERNADVSHSMTSGGLTGWQIRRVTGFVDSHLDENIRVEDLSQVVSLSPTYFSRAFKRSFGETPHTYVIRRRVEQARHLILTSDIALSEVAQTCGFGDQAHLCRLFRQRVGASPAAWRRERRDSNACKLE
jgi:AraC family transcriptional regulator